MLVSMSGVLGWEIRERFTGRFGAIYLLDQVIDGKRNDFGCFYGCDVGRLVAEVLETRLSRHRAAAVIQLQEPVRIGDIVVLGIGRLRIDRSAIGIVPSRPDTFPWLNVNELMRLHDQTVVLKFEPS